MKEKLKVNLSTILLILSLFIILYMGVIIYKLYNENILDTQSSSDISSAEDVKIDSDYGDLISDYLKKVWLGLELYEDNMPEFENVKSAPKDYLAFCAAWGITETDGKTEFNDFNNSLINLFGPEANNLIEKSDMKDVLFVIENPDGTYDFAGFGGSETHFNDYIINKIEKEDNIFTVTLYEYKSILDDMTLDLEVGESTHERIYDKKDNLILTTTIKVLENSIVTLDENGNEVESLQHLLLTKYEDKLSVRTITLQYNSDINSFIMLNNKLEK